MPLAPEIGCPPGLPSYWLWDSLAAYADYLTTGSYFSVCDWPGITGQPDPDILNAHLILHETPKALRVQYPFAQQWHFAIRPHDAATRQVISTQTGVSINDIDLAMFAGLINVNITGQFDLISGAFNAVYNAVKKAISDASTQNYYALAQDAYNTIQTQENSTATQKDQAYYDVSNISQTYKAINNWPQVLAMVKKANQNGTSIADALQNAVSISDNVSGLVPLHRENEARATAAVQDPSFSTFASESGADPAQLKVAWLRDAGAPINPKPVLVLPNLHPGLGAFARSGSSALNPDTSGIGPLLVGAAAVGGLLYVLSKRKRR